MISDRSCRLVFYLLGAFLVTGCNHLKFKERETNFWASGSTNVAVYFGRITDGTYVEISIYGVRPGVIERAGGRALVAWVRPATTPGLPVERLAPFEYHTTHDGFADASLMNARTRLRQFQVFVTVERSTDAAIPAWPPILWADVDAE